MSLSTTVSPDGSTVTIAISGRFDFGIHREFRNAYEKAEVKSANPKYVVDLGGTEYMDSSALGMLFGGC